MATGVLFSGTDLVAGPEITGRRLTSTRVIVALAGVPAFTSDGRVPNPRLTVSSSRSLSRLAVIVNVRVEEPLENDSLLPLPRPLTE